MILYRIGYQCYAADPLNGEGSFLYGGRWSSPGTRMAYTSTTLSLAMAEFLANVDVNDFDPDTPPALSYLTATIPDRSARTLDDLRLKLPRGWDGVPAPAADIRVGDHWIASAASLALVVPSVHVPIATPERNVLINPLHRDFRRITTTTAEFAYDRRLLRARALAATPPKRETPRERRA